MDKFGVIDMAVNLFTYMTEAGAILDTTWNREVTHNINLREALTCGKVAKITFSLTGMSMINRNSKRLRTHDL